MTTSVDQALARIRGARPGPFKHAAIERLLWELRVSLNPKTRPEPRIRIIGLSGDPGAGKDTVGHMLATTAGYSPLAFADALRREVVKAWHVADHQVLTDRAMKDLRMLRWAIDQCDSSLFLRRMALDGHDIQLPRSPREILQLWGQWRRSQNPGYWIGKLDDFVRSSVAGGEHRFVITDVRFRNELAYVHAHGGEAWRVVRPEAAANRTAHVSCQELASVTLDREVHNTGTLEHLAAEVERVLHLHDAGVMA